MADEQQKQSSGINWKLVTIFVAGIAAIWAYFKTIDSSRYDYVIQEIKDVKADNRTKDSIGKIKDSINTSLRVEIAQLEEQLKKYDKKIDSLNKK